VLVGADAGRDGHDLGTTRPLTRTLQQVLSRTTYKKRARPAAGSATLPPQYQAGHRSG
jgi:hypothetical protein